MSAGMRKRVAGLCLLLALCGSPLAGAQTPSVRTLTANLEPRTSFEPGERFAVEGTGFPPNASIGVAFVTDDATTELGPATSRDDGSFLARVRVPPSAATGAATVSTSGGGLSVTAAVGIGDETAPAEGPAALWPWAVVLAAIATYVFVVWRRRGSGREATRERRSRRADDDQAGTAPVSRGAKKSRGGRGVKKKEERSNRVRKLSDDVSAWPKKR